jgi:hippurate hydrolase
MKLFARIALATALLPSYAAMAQDVAKHKAEVASQVNGMYPKLDAIYKDLHAHPEIAFQEVRTAAKLAAEMRAIGFEVTEKVGKTGLVAIYKKGPGRTIMDRTQTDALPMEEKTRLD